MSCNSGVVVVGVCCRIVLLYRMASEMEKTAVTQQPNLIHMYARYCFSWNVRRGDKIFQLLACLWQTVIYILNGDILF